MSGSHLPGGQRGSPPDPPGRPPAPGAGESADRPRRTTGGAPAPPAGHDRDRAAARERDEAAPYERDETTPYERDEATPYAAARERQPAAREARRPRPARPAVSPTRARLRRKLASREELRDAFLLHEILGPPVSLRDPRGRSSPR